MMLIISEDKTYVAKAIAPIIMFAMQTTLTTTMTTAMKMTTTMTMTTMLMMTMIEEGTHCRLVTKQTAADSDILAKYYGGTEGRTDTAEYRDARTHLKLISNRSSVSRLSKVAKERAH